MIRTVLETRIRGRLINRKCKILDLVHLSNAIWVCYQTPEGKTRHKKYYLFTLPKGEDR